MRVSGTLCRSLTKYGLYIKICICSKYIFLERNNYHFNNINKVAHCMLKKHIQTYNSHLLVCEFYPDEKRKVCEHLKQ